MATEVGPGLRCEQLSSSDQPRSSRPREILLHIPWLPLLPNRKGQKRHWAVEHKYRKAWHTAVRAALGTQRPPEPWPHSHLTLTRRSDKQPDEDNLMASWKPVIDGLRACGVIEDDSPKHVIVRSNWKHAPRGQGAISVVVTRCEAWE